MPLSNRSSIVLTVLALCVAGVAAGLVGVRVVHTLILANQSVAANFMPSLAALLTAQEGLASTRSSTTRAILATSVGRPEDVDSLWREREEALARAGRGLATFETYPMTEEEAGLWREASAAFVTFSAENGHVWSALRGRDVAGALRIQEGLTQRFRGQLLGPFDRLVDAQKELAQASAARAATTGGLARRTLLALVTGTVLAAGVFGWLLVRGESRLQAALAANERMIGELREALENVKTLSGMLPICMYCKKIRDDQGYWARIEAYISKRTDARFSHGMCPECFAENFPEESWGGGGPPGKGG